VLWALLVPAIAQVYKWVDEKGVTHYGERARPRARRPRKWSSALPTPGRRRKEVQPGWKEQDLEFRRRRIEAEQTEAKDKQQESSQRRACNQARDQLALMKSARGLYRLNEAGERVFQSDEERKASIARLEQLISERCR